MSDKFRCNCRRCVIRGLMWPALFISVGLLFLLSETRGGDYDFRYTFPVVLIVMGFVSLASAIAPMDGHISSSTPVPPPAAPGTSFAPPASPQNPISGQGQ